MTTQTNEELRALVAAQVETIDRLTKATEQSQASYRALAMELAAAKANAAPAPFTPGKQVEPEDELAVLLRLWSPLEDGKNVHMVITTRRYGAPESLEETNSHHEFLYDEHTCPTNWLGVAMIIEGDDTDPHGVFHHVQTIEIPMNEAGTGRIDMGHLSIEEIAALFDKFEPVQQPAAAPAQQGSGELPQDERAAFEKAVNSRYPMPKTPEELRAIQPLRVAYRNGWNDLLAQRAASVPEDELDHGDTVLRVQAALGCTDDGWISPDVILLRIEQLKASIDPWRDAPLWAKPAASVPAEPVQQGQIVIGFPDPEAVFAQFCEREGYPSDGPFDSALRKAFYEGTKLGHPVASVPQDIGRDAALEMKKAIIAVISYGHLHSESPTAKFAKELLGAIERDDRVAKALATPPANVAQAAPPTKEKPENG